MDFNYRSLLIQHGGNEWRSSVAGDSRTPPAFRIIPKNQMPLCFATLNIGQILRQDLEAAHTRRWITTSVTQREFVAEKSSACFGQLAEIIVSVGLAQNLAALRALATEGIQRGHMGLHARQVAIAAGASEEQVNKLADQLVAEGKVRVYNINKRPVPVQGTGLSCLFRYRWPPGRL